MQVQRDHEVHTLEVSPAFSKEQTHSKAHRKLCILPMKVSRLRTVQVSISNQYRLWKRQNRRVVGNPEAQEQLRDFRSAVQR